MGASCSLFLWCNCNVEMECIMVLEIASLRPVLYSIKHVLYLTTKWSIEKNKSLKNNFLINIRITIYIYQCPIFASRRVFVFLLTFSSFDFFSQWKIFECKEFSVIINKSMPLWFMSYFVHHKRRINKLRWTFPSNWDEKLSQLCIAICPINMP